MKKIIQLSAIFFFLISFQLQAGSFSNTDLYVGNLVDCVNNKTPVNFKLSSFYHGYNVGDTLMCIFNYGDGTIDTLPYEIQPDTGTWVNIFANHTYDYAGTYSVQGILIGPDLVADTSVKINAVTRLDSCGNVKGRVYNDYNNDCIFNGNDRRLSNAHVLIKKNGEYFRSILTDSLGLYSIDLPQNSTYTVEMSNNLGLSVICPTTGSHTVSTFPSIANDFAMECPSNIPEFKTFFSGDGGGAIPGKTSRFSVMLFNMNCKIADGTIKLVFEDSLLSYVGNPIPSQAVVSGDTVSWNFSNMSYNDWKNFTFEGLTDTTAMLGDIVCIKVIINSSSLPNDLILRGCTPVISSYDPNDISVHPIGVGSEGKIAANTDLTYTIRFQNTGNHQAYNIYILDTLDTDVYDLSTIQIVGASHEMRTDLISPNHNVLRFRFEDINLPDSISDEEGSQGWVTYKIKQKVDLPKGTKFENSAAIYFDYNPPIYTNTVLNTIDDRIVGIDKHVEAETPRFVQLYPNPASEVVYVEFNGDASANYDVTVYNINGQKIRQLRTNKSLAIDVSSLAKGLYFVEVQSKIGERQISKLVINR